MKKLLVFTALLLLASTGFAQNLKGPSIHFPSTAGKAPKLNSFVKDPVFRLEQFKRPEKGKIVDLRKQGLQNTPKAKMPVFKPDSTIHHHLLAVKPDSTKHYHIRNKKPE